jgi:hypothetical protein
MRSCITSARFTKVDGEPQLRLLDQSVADWSISIRDQPISFLLPTLFPFFGASISTTPFCLSVQRQ